MSLSRNDSLLITRAIRVRNVFRLIDYSNVRMYYSTMEVRDKDPHIPVKFFAGGQMNGRTVGLSSSTTGVKTLFRPIKRKMCTYHHCINYY